jgi:signal transduction histidine kinase
MFEPLRRGDLSIASHKDGLGLGLFIVREITRAHRGRVEVNCDEQAGETTFAVCLPR